MSTTDHDAIRHDAAGHAAQPAEDILLPAEEQARADLYALVATLLFRAPDAPILAALAGAPPLASTAGDNPLDDGWRALVDAARSADPAAVSEEFDALFVSIGTPPLNPYASHYLTGFMMERPLAALREDLAQLGLARAAGVGEPEDHLAALCEAMRAMIAGLPGHRGGLPLARQRRFFRDHIAPWYGRCLDDIRDAQAAAFYRHAAVFARAFLDIEFQAFEIEDAFDLALPREEAPKMQPDAFLPPGATP